MPTAVQAHTTPTTKPPGPSRRGIFGASAALLAASVAAATAAAAPALAGTVPDPVLVLYQRFRELEDAISALEASSDSLRSQLIKRWGRPSGYPAAAHPWGHDPDFDQLSRNNRESDRLLYLSIDLTESITATPAVTLAGIRAKMQMCLDLWPDAGNACDEAHAEVAFAAIKDAVRLLNEVLA
jgi:hypothetical protein